MRAGYFLLVIVVIAAGYLYWDPPVQNSAEVDSLFRNESSGVMVQTQGIVRRILPDDLEGSAHQRFVIEAPSGLTLLVWHNIDLAPRVSGLTVGDSLTVHGQYEWNSKGGVLHWTHHDPRGRHDPGWIEFQGKRYE